MGCTHDRIKTVNCDVFCLLCGEKLPADWLTGKNTPAQYNAVKTPENGEKTASAKPTRKRKV